MFGLTIAFLVSQILAGIAIVFDLFSFQFKERKKIIIFLILSAISISLHYLFLERYVGAAVLLLGVIRFVISYHSTKKFWMYVFITITALLTYLLYKDVYDTLILIGTSFITVGVFQENDKLLRLFIMFGTLFTIVYNVLVFSPVGVVLEGMFLVSNLVGYFKHYLRK